MPRPLPAAEPAIRRAVAGEERLLWEVFHASVHTLAKAHYTREQLEAWAPDAYPGETWVARVRKNRPYVALLGGIPVGFADVQASGYIDQFFVAGAASGRGIGTRLMQTLERSARAERIPRLYSNVSLSAEPFFRKHGFIVERRQEVSVNGVSLRNARMFRVLSPVDEPGSRTPG